MFNKKIQNAINDQIQRELESAQIYLSMAAYFDSVNLPGFAQWMKMQFQEEQAHAFRFYDYVFDRGGQVILQALGQPPTEFQSPLDVLEQTLAHEQKVTGHINDLYAVIGSERAKYQRGENDVHYNDAGRQNPPPLFSPHPQRSTDTRHNNQPVSQQKATT